MIRSPSNPIGQCWVLNVANASTVFVLGLLVWITAIKLLRSLNEGKSKDQTVYARAPWVPEFNVSRNEAIKVSTVLYCHTKIWPIIIDASGNVFQMAVTITSCNGGNARVKPICKMFSKDTEEHILRGGAETNHYQIQDGKNPVKGKLGNMCYSM
ncbi:uncharacterized protein MELLADRAFT_114326 [Melampsora larici-populina 98AG31]|uniref:Uncharacterized protein n=1 Tax=Melampsora larici-populina (strain 98AG31 / pathotype 3-4-7) TaxID=747676 RepID=F4SD19_MELLP|nr:uncharacterized protein MELLADRAFT_114326 [Melampsora larici-populina 98AG31]EGF97457.1 hypothetical protein MELLADRAFT_114326 [Melampsora larici-populina 98AG31]